MSIFVFLGSLFVFLTLGIPIAIVLILCAVVLMIYLGNFNPEIIAQSMVMGANNFPLMAVPFFMLAGEIMSRGGLSKQIVEFANIVVGRFKGGLGYAAILASMIFAGLSGSAVADAAALGSILVPLMVQKGYKADRATGLICAGAVIAPIIPPSIPMILLGVTAGISIGKLFLAGIVPGIILGLALMICWKWIAVKDGYTDKVTYTKTEARQIVKKSLPALMMPIIIIGGIRFGIFTPTEAGSFAVVYAFLVALFVYKELTFKELPEVFIAAAKMTSVVMFIVASASAVAWLLTVAQIPTQMASMFTGFIDSPLLLLIILNIFLFLVGMVMDLTPAVLIFAPVLFPIIKVAGIDPYFFGVIMVLNLTIGLITPPVGTILYLGCSVGKISFPRMIRGVFPFLVTEIIVLFLYVFFPQIILAPLNWFY
ncbi:MAG: L-dehydroascorbate transporter large permease subunit [Peptococcaceae bacterium BICA1-8]|nr:MAG: L-dehydroascorbate transporter large permease subunit [Peptococcaceae bacterium BICA1-8]